jgi:Xaa-Pro aminopeptidase
MTVKEKIRLIREAMKNRNIQACIIPTTDPHIGEYTPTHWKTRQWVSGFTGSAGTLAITETKAGLWTDSRYFLQAEEQLQQTDIQLFKAGLPETPTPEAWLSKELLEGDVIGLEGAVYAASDALSFIDFFGKYNIRIESDFAPYDQIWNNRPPLPSNKSFILPEQFSGESVRSKINRLLKELAEKNCNCTLLASLDMIAWLFNLRGNDIEYNPLTISYAIVSEKETILFIHPEKLTSEIISYLQKENVNLAEYEKVYDYVSTLCQQNSQANVLITPSKINYKLYSSIPKECRIIETNVHPVDYLKTIKNETEITGFRRAMQKDGTALVKFFYWLEKQIFEKQTVTELDISVQLKKFRNEQKGFFCESFETIAAYGAHGAIVHYSPVEATQATIHPEGILLIDSGAQYPEGTTDITRTIAVGPVSDEMKKDYTRILKGHIQLAKAKFPKGTIGMQLDVLARQFIWNEGQNFLHGTGHGVGHFLNVHEGPQSIRMNYNPTPLLPGMITSNEPGLYKTGRYGIRIENLLLTTNFITTDWGEYCAFETLTLCPIDKQLIDYSLMSPDEIQWLNDYHQKVYEQLSPFLSEKEKEWLKQKTLKD